MDFGLQLLDLKILYKWNLDFVYLELYSGFICRVKYNKISPEFRLNDKSLVNDL